MTKLTKLDMGFNLIADISPLKNLNQVSVLYLPSNSVIDLSPLSGKSCLTQLDVDNNQVSDISVLGGLTNLAVFLGQGNKISDISVVSSWPNCDQLDLGNNNLTTFSAVGSLTKIADISVVENPIPDGDLHVLKDKVDLHYVSISSTYMTDLQDLVDNPNFQKDVPTDPDHLWAENCPLTDHAINVEIPELEGKGVVVIY